MSEHNELNQNASDASEFLSSAEEKAKKLTEALYDLEAVIYQKLQEHKKMLLEEEAYLTEKNFKIVAPEIEAIKNKETLLEENIELSEKQKKELADIERQLQQIENNLSENKRRELINKQEQLKLLKKDQENIDWELVQYDLLAFAKNPNLFKEDLRGSLDKFIKLHSLYDCKEYKELNQAQRYAVKEKIKAVINPQKTKEEKQEERQKISMEVEKIQDEIRILEQDTAEERTQSLQQEIRKKEGKIIQLKHSIASIDQMIQTAKQTRSEKECLKAMKLQMLLDEYFRHYYKLSLEEKEQKWQQNAELCNRIIEELNKPKNPEEADDVNIKNNVNNIIEDATNYVKCNQYYKKCIEEELLKKIQESVPEKKGCYSVETLNALSEFKTKLKADQISFADYKKLNRNSLKQNIVDTQKALTEFQEKWEIYNSASQLDRGALVSNVVAPLQVLAESFNKLAEYERLLKDDTYNHLVFNDTAIEPEQENVDENDIKLTTLGRLINIAGVKATIFREWLAKQHPNEMELSNLQLNQNIELGEDAESSDAADEQQQPQNRLDGVIETNLKNEHEIPKSLINEKNRAKYEDYKREQQKHEFKRSFSF